ncbi:MAG TPA: hypothetical protein VKE24_13825 [Candidatus Acidoferrales bacterium]|nr:hypothetical protein [Candidatus Acidoferrales bacterium]
MKLAKIRGWVAYEPDSLYKTFNVLSAKEIDEVKQRLLELKQQEQARPQMRLAISLKSRGAGLASW